jgi:hypothetical protein
VVVIGILYYVYCKIGVKRAELESLLTYRAIRQFAATHLQQQTILTVAQVDVTHLGYEYVPIAQSYRGNVMVLIVEFSHYCINKP